MLAVQGCDPGAAVWPPATLATGGPALCSTSALPHCAEPELDTVSYRYISIHHNIYVSPHLASPQTAGVRVLGEQALQAHVLAVLAVVVMLPHGARARGQAALVTPALDGLDPDGALHGRYGDGVDNI